MDASRQSYVHTYLPMQLWAKEFLKVTGFYTTFKESFYGINMSFLHWEWSWNLPLWYSILPADVTYWMPSLSVFAILIKSMDSKKKFQHTMDDISYECIFILFSTYLNNIHRDISCQCHIYVIHRFFKLENSWCLYFTWLYSRYVQCW